LSVCATTEDMCTLKGDLENERVRRIAEGISCERFGGTEDWIVRGSMVLV